MLRSLTPDLNRLIRRLNLFEKIEERRVLKKTEAVLAELAGADRISSLKVRPLSCKKGVLLIWCEDSSTAHYLKSNEGRIKNAARVERVRYIS
ncbi:MAG: hypothetical protein A2939_05435 [Parcubacteria group bacterium RIFCSPLOWO2_01_FULL_48_18]|nr:MAG: hypothetical protein A3J67_06535 [Parcubacteria group bacterium RIFCSPHIGHO2_02_FULL_48_10b]OHB22540.1 MAG: hypothetical protein A2939_05435 [Parcubacteria group bacterium RIFCSPLOWO2_01_FULL_48_18]